MTLCPLISIEPYMAFMSASETSNPLQLRDRTKDCLTSYIYLLQFLCFTILGST